MLADLSLLCQMRNWHNPALSSDAARYAAAFLTEFANVSRIDGIVFKNQTILLDTGLASAIRPLEVELIPHLWNGGFQELVSLGLISLTDLGPDSATVTINPEFASFIELQATIVARTATSI